MSADLFEKTERVEYVSLGQKRSASVPETVPQLLTLLDVAKALCVSPHTVRAWVSRGRLHPIRLCRRLLFHPNEVARLLSAAE